MLQAIENIEPDDRDPTGCALLSLAQQCQTLENAKTMVRKLCNAIRANQEDAITGGLQAISRGDRMVVAYLDSPLLKLLLASKPWQEENASTYELLIDWAQYHRPQAKFMVSFMQKQGLENAADWRRCPSALREEAIAAGILQKPADLTSNSLRYVRTVDPEQNDLDVRTVEFIDANELFIYAEHKITRWDVETGKKDCKFPIEN